MAQVQLRALGECAVETAVARIGPESRYVFALALYLALERGKRIPRQALVDLLWPDVRNEGHARHRFRQTLLRLKQLGFPVISEQAHVRLEREAVHADFDSLLHANGDAEAVVRSRDSFEFLHGYQPRISEQFATWLDLHRSRVELTVQRLFVHALKSARTRGDWVGLEQLALSCLRIDPLNEEATIVRAEATAMRGSKAQALRILDAYMDALGDTSVSIGLPAKTLRARIAERLTLPQYTTLTEAHFVGREAEVAELTEMIDRARRGRGSATLLIGAAGIGKTRLLTEISRVATLKGVTVAAVSCQPATADRPIGLLADLVTVLRSLPGSIGASVETLSLLQRLTEYSEPPQSLSDAGETGGAGAAIRRAVLDLFEAVSEESALLVTIEDAHWADPFSWKVIRTIAELASRRRVAIVATSRHHVDAWNTGRSGDLDPLTIQELPPLALSASHVLVERLLADHGTTIPQNMLGWCVAVAEGNPYYLRELLVHWLDRQEPFGVPRSLAELVDGRLSRLTADALRIFQACVAFGSSCTVARLEQIEASEPARLLQALEELSSAGIIDADGSQVAAKHDLLAQAAERKVSPATKALLHRRIAAVLEAESTSEPIPASLWECAHHWELAGEPERAVDFLAGCGQHLMSIGLPEEATALYRRALELAVSDCDRRFRLHEGLITALRQSGLLEQVRREISTLREAARIRGHRLEVHSDLELLEVEAHWRAEGASASLIQTLRTCLSATEASTAHRLQAGFWLHAAAHAVGDADLAHNTWTKAEPLILNSASDPVPRYQFAMVYHTDYGDLDRAAECARLLVASARSTGQPLVLLRALRNAALSLRRAGHWGEAKGLLYEAFEAAAQQHAALIAADAAHQIAALLTDEGELSSAEDWLRTADEWIARCESAFQASDVILAKARIALRMRDRDGAAKLAAGLPDWRTDTSLQRSQVVISILLGIVTDYSDPRARELVHEAEARYARLGNLGHQDFPVQSLVEAMINVGRRQEGTLLLQEYLDGKRRDRGPVPGPLLEVCRSLGVEYPTGV